MALLSSKQYGDGTVAFIDIQTISTTTLLGRASAGLGSVEQISLGANLSYTGTTLNTTGVVTSVSGTTNRISITGTSVAPIVDISSGYIGQSTITTVGIIATGTWQGNIINQAYLGSGGGTAVKFLREDNTWQTLSTGNLTMAAIGAAPNANAATIVGSVLNLQPASGSFGGVVTTGAQTFAGIKTFSVDSVINALTVGRGTGSMLGNVAFGYRSLNANTTGNQNVGIGQDALYSNTTGGNNTAIGVSALTNNTIGAGNIAIGASALSLIISGANNISIGVSSLSNATGSNNVAYGFQSGTAITTGTENTLIGGNTLASSTTGTGNAIVGHQVLTFATSGDYNTGIGYRAGMFVNAGTNNTSASYSTFIGSNTQSLAVGQTNEIVIGYNALGKGTNTVVLGADNIISTYLKGNVSIGGVSPTEKLHVVGNIKTIGNLFVSHIIGNSATPTIAVATGSGTGTGPSASITGTDLAGQITVTLGSNPNNQFTSYILSDYELATITFNVAYGAIPSAISLTCANFSSILKFKDGGFYVDSSTITATSFKVYFNGTSNSISNAVLKFHYQVIQ